MEAEIKSNHTVQNTIRCDFTDGCIPSCSCFDCSGLGKKEFRPNLNQIKKAAQLEVKEESIQLLNWTLYVIETSTTIYQSRQRIHARIEKLKNSEKIASSHGQR